MNRVYKSVWNEQRGTWIAAPESAGRGGARSVVRAGAAAVLLALGLPLAAHAQLSLGLGAAVTGTNGIALGALLGGGTLASGNNSIALGVGGVSAGSQSISVGYGSLVSAAGTGGLALGGGTSVTGSGSIAIGLGSSDGGLANVLSVGTAALQRKIINVADGTLSAASHEVVTGAQLYATNTGQATLGAALATSLGGGSSYSLAAGVTVPSYTIRGSAILGVGAALTALDGAIGTNLSAMADLELNINNGNVGLVRQANGTSPITVGVATGGTSVDFTGTSGARQLTGVAAGTLSAGSTQAVNGAQLFATNQQVAANTTAISTNTTNIASNTSDIATHTTAIAGLSASAVQYDNAGKGLITLGGASGTTISNVAAGTLSAGSTQAVNGAQLFATNQQVAANTTAINTNTTNIATNTSDIASLSLQLNSGTAGLVQQAGAGQAITIGANTNGTSVNVAGAAGDRQISGVAAGTLAAGSTQAVNGGQLFATNQQVAANTTNIAANTSDIATNAANISTNTASIANHTSAIAANTASINTNTASIGANTTAIAALGANAVQYSDAGKSLLTLGGAGGTVIGNLTAGLLSAGSTQAVNGAQLYATNQQVAANTASLASLSNVIVNGQGGAAQSDNTAGAAVPLASGANASAVGFGASATAAGSAALGNGAVSTGAGSVALGQGSDDGGAANVVSVGSSSQKRRIVQVADGVADSDAATAGQVRTVDDKLTGLSARAVSYDLNADQSTNFASVSFGIAGSPVLLRNVAAGTLGTDAANVSQLQSVAGFLGGGAALGNNGSFTAPSFSIVQMAANGSTSTASYSNVGSAFASINASITNMAAHVAAANDMLTTMNGRVATLSGGGGSNTTLITNNLLMDTQYLNVNSDELDSRAAGDDSLAFGPTSTAHGNESVAIGSGATAWTASAVAIGDGASAGGGKSVSIGYANIAMGNGAVALGDPNVATGTGAVAVGADNTATGDGAVALGNLNVATGNGAVALGNLSTANGTGAIALGNAASATVAGGVALGSGAVANRAGMAGTREAISNVAVASTQAAVSVGSAGNERQITNVAGGTEDTDAVNLRQLRAAQATAVEVASQAMDAKLNSLAQGLDRVERNSNAGTASAMAMAGMPQSMVPGKSMVAAGVGSYGGQTALAVGVSLMSDTGKWVAKFNGSASTRGKVGVSAGVGFQF